MISIDSFADLASFHFREETPSRREHAGAFQRFHDL